MRQTAENSGEMSICWEAVAKSLPSGLGRSVQSVSTRSYVLQYVPVLNIADLVKFDRITQNLSGQPQSRVLLSIADMLV